MNSPPALHPGPHRTSPPNSPARVALVIDNDSVSLELMERWLSRLGLRVVVATGGEEGLTAARQARPDVILLDVEMPGLDGWAVLTALKGDPQLADVPVIMTTMVDERAKGLALGAAEYLVKPIDRQQLGHLIGRLTADAPRPPAAAARAKRALVLEDDATNRELLAQYLTRDGWSVTQAKDGAEGLAALAAHGLPDLILLDLIMPGVDGYRFLDALAAVPGGATVPVVVITALDLNSGERRRLGGAVRQVFLKGTHSRADLLRAIRAQV